MGVKDIEIIPTFYFGYENPIKSKPRPKPIGYGPKPLVSSD
jgi:hypothetical protein